MTDESLLKKNIDQMKRKSTDELINIWLHNNRSKYSDVTFRAIEQVLLERNISPPLQEKETNNENDYKRSFITPIIITLLLLTMAITNPNKEEYTNYIKEKVIQESKGDILVTGITMLLGKPLIENTTTTTNFILFSVFTTNIDNNEIAFLGIFKNFIPLSNSQTTNTLPAQTIPSQEGNSQFSNNTSQEGKTQPSNLPTEKIYPSESEINAVMRRTIEYDDPSTHFGVLSSSPITVSDGYDGWITAVVGTRYPTADGYGKLVFFWHDKKFIGWNAVYESISAKIVDYGTGYFIVSYPQYASRDPLSSPSLSNINITYTWNGNNFTSTGDPPQNTFGGSAKLIYVKYLE